MLWMHHDMVNILLNTVALHQWLRRAIYSHCELGKLYVHSTWCSRSVVVHLREALCPGSCIGNFLVQMLEYRRHPCYRQEPLRYRSIDVKEMSQDVGHIVVRLVRFRRC